MGGNNFSHNSSVSSQAGLSQTESSCRRAEQTVSETETTYVFSTDSGLFRFGTPALRYLRT
jgi:hypothetical protein